MTVEIGSRYVVGGGAVACVVGKLPVGTKSYPYVAIVVLNSGNSFVEYFNEKGQSKTKRLNIQSVVSQAS